MNYLVYICSQHVLIFKGEDQYSYGHHFHAKRKLPTSLLRQNSTFLKIIYLCIYYICK